MKKLAIILVGIMGWIAIISFVVLSLTCRVGYGIGLTNMIAWDIWERNDNILPDSSKLVGIWVASDGATIRLNSDGSCALHNAKKYTRNRDDEEELIPFYDNIAQESDSSVLWNFDGYWCIKPRLSYPKKDTVGYEVCLSSTPLCDCKEVRKQQRCYMLWLRIHNNKKFFSKEITPSILYSLVGDPDPYETYAFYKQE